MKLSRESVYSGLLLSVIAAVQLSFVPGHYLGQEHDDAQYVLAARSILRGEYALGVSPGDPRLTFVTPGWPALLAPAAVVSGESPAGYELWAWAWLVLCDVLAWVWFRRRMGPMAAAAAAVFFGLNPLVLSRAGVVMSELPFLAAALGFLLLLEGRKGPGREPPAWAMGLYLGGAWLIRPAAVALWPVACGHYLYKRRWRQAAYCLLGAGVPVLLWKLWVGAQGAQLAELSEVSSALAGRSAGALAALAAGNLRQAVSLWGAACLPWAASSGVEAANFIWGAALIVFSAWGIGRRKTGGYEPAAGFLIAGAALHAAFPWWYERYLPPFIPFLVWGLWRGLARLSGKDAVQAGALGGLAALVLAGQGGAVAARARALERPELREAYAWIRGNTAPESAFASAFYCRDAIYTGRPFAPLPDPKDRGLEESLKERKVRFVLWQSPPDLGSSFGERFPWAAGLRRAKAQLDLPPFRAVYVDEAQGAAVYVIEERRPARASAAKPAASRSGAHR